METLRFEKCMGFFVATTSSWRYEPCTVRIVNIDGEIVLGDERTFEHTVNSLPESRHPSWVEGPFVHLQSPGGNVLAAIRIAQIIRSFQLTTFVDPYEYCYSACFYIWAAGESRIADATSRLGVHQSSILGIATLEGTLDGAKLLRYWGIPDSLTDAMLATPPGQIYILSKSEIRNTKRGDMLGLHQLGAPSQRDVVRLQ